MTFGDLLYRLLRDKSINISELSDKLGIKSKNEIYRLFENKCSYDKAKSLVADILSVVPVTAAEKETLFGLMDELKIKSGVKTACTILEKLYRETEVSVNDSFTEIEKFLTDNKNSRIGLFIDVYADHEFALFLDEFLSSVGDECDITIIHTVNFNKPEAVIASELLAMVKLLPHDGYHCFETQKPRFGGVVGLSESESGCRLFVLTKDNEYIRSDISRELYDYLNKKYSSCAKDADKDIKRVHLSIRNIPELILANSPIETNNAFSFVGSFCSCDIPFETMCDMFKDSDFFGLPLESEYTTGILSAVRERFSDEAKTGTRTYVLSEERIINMLKTGRTVDHVDSFRSLTKREMYLMISSMVKKGKLKYKFYKQGYSVRSIELVVAENFGIVLWNAACGYGKKYFQAVVNHPKLMSVIKSFEDWVWENCTLSEEESRVILRRLLDKYLGNIK